MATAAPPYSEFITSRRFGALDGLRAIAVLLVVTWHVRSGAFAAIHGKNGVTLFFVISGFLITTLALKEEFGQRRFHYSAFLVRRAFRILPLFWLCTATYAVMIFGLHLDDRSTAYGDALPWYFGYMPEVPVFRAGPVFDHGQGAVPFSGAWSLGIEEKFYLIWPVIAFALLARRRFRGLVALALALGIWALQVGDAEWGRYVWSYAPIFLGCAIAMALHRKSTYEFVARASHPVVLFSAVAALAALSLLEVNVYGEIALQICAGILLAGLVVRPSSIGARVLSCRLAVWLGAMSYALYLFHSLGLKVADKVVPESDSLWAAALVMIIGLAIALPACQVLHSVVEVPLQNVGRRLSKRIKSAGASVDESVAVNSVPHNRARPALAEAIE